MLSAVNRYKRGTKKGQGDGNLPFSIAVIDMVPRSPIRVAWRCPSSSTFRGGPGRALRGYRTGPRCCYLSAIGM
jgi:hypothetical protein